MPETISTTGAFLAGLISFLSPCVLPLVPAYLSFLAGLNLEALKEPGDGDVRRRVLLASVFFVLGFSTVFVLLGASATVVGRWLTAQSVWIGRAAGVLLIVLGLHLTGLVKIPFLLYEKRLQVRQRRISLPTVYLIGAAFAFGWSPCVGPLLAGILALAGSRDTVGQGMTLLAVYSAGLGLPFILAALAIERFMRFMQKFRSYVRWIEIAAGLLLLAIGVVMLTGGMQRLSGWFGAFGRFSL